ncbi:hypothetical protein EZ428_16260 [Pedobacter frigiditerrae]|uniref:SprB repeat-containing protein n=1 Tax=Pedobacter frigiditerrae TaxID=2530452 RepID=A0A4R0MQR3_9SPHI|nr:hypothetical protein [Pedobacter frigiditerrae]TCC89249.1 hypothetical protein EZ428_16260 [Pedobacter frigiditerrae]
MKKLLILLILLVAISHIANAQKCECNPNGFNPFVFSYQKTNQTVRDGHQFSVKCKTPFTLNGGYKCSYTGQVCEVKLNATLKNAAGAIIKTYSNFTFPLQYEFETGGNYILEIFPVCGGKKCPGVKFYFGVTCDEVADCNCNKAGWDNIYAAIDNVSKLIACGSTINLKKDQPFSFKGGYKCDGNCDAILNAKLTNLGTGTVQNFLNFKIDGVNSPFTTAGKYRFVINPLCKNKKCPPCTFNIIVN